MIVLNPNMPTETFCAVYVVITDSNSVMWDPNDWSPSSKSFMLKCELNELVVLNGTEIIQTLTKTAEMRQLHSPPWVRLSPQ